ncbi:protein-tyrosine phosphatase family protein [Lentzea albidocapillata]|uniref:protein-tyrosine phosphatase family protein n=1 Tax=Lentzea albidocapillata TaxID=40571 RepID=UPI001B80D6E2|nr:dual specificity protein phosphatase family protein [Lentzea albidocapillata]
MLYTVARPGPGTVSTMSHPAGGMYLEGKIRELRRVGVDVLVSTQTDSERVECDLVDEEKVVVAAGLQYVCFPIEDRAVPDVESAVAAVQPLHALYRRGAHVVFHCWAGIGRSSLLAGLLLGMDGVSPGEAWGLIAAARGWVVPDTAEQGEWLAAWWDGRETH